MENNDNKITIADLVKVFKSDTIRSTEAIRKITLSVDQGEIVCILGRSGCGKTTLLNIIAGLLEPTSGMVCIFGKSPQEAKSQITYIQQYPHLLPYRSVFTNAALGLELRGELNSEGIARIYKLLQFLGLSEFLSYYPSELSGGMQQRVALAMTLAVKARLVLCDEPLASLDLENRLEIEDFFWAECKSEERASIFVTHQIDSAIALADRIILLSPRPARIMDVISIDSTFRKMPPRDRRIAKNFSDLYAATWNSMRKAADL